MPRIFLSTVVFAFFIGPAFALPLTPSLEMPEDEYVELRTDIVDTYFHRYLDSLDSAELDWLKLACGVIIEREALQYEAAIAEGNSYMAATTAGVCDYVAAHHGLSR